MELGGARVFGLRLSADKDGSLVFDRGNEILQLPSDGQLFSMCGKLVGHFPIGGWLRVTYT